MKKPKSYVPATWGKANAHFDYIWLFEKIIQERKKRVAKANQYKPDSRTTAKSPAEASGLEFA
jgi:hypothetical protein